MDFSCQEWTDREICIQENSRYPMSSLASSVLYNVFPRFAYTSLQIILFVLLLLPISSHAYSNDLYTLQIDLPSDIVNDVIVRTTLPAGLIYSSVDPIVSGVSANPIQTISAPNDGSVPVIITWNFGNMDNSADEDILVHFQIVVMDVPANHDGSVLDSVSSELQWTSVDGSVHTNSGNFKSIEIIEPKLGIERSFSPTSGWRDDEISCILSISHSSDSSADAYDVDIKDILPEGMSLVPGSMDIISGPKRSESDYEDLHWHFPQVDRSWNSNQKIQLCYKATIDSQVQGEDSMKCLATLDWTSTLGDNTNERHYTKSSESGIMLIPRLPAFNITLADNPDPVSTGGKVNYTISYKNTGSYSLGTTVSIDYDPSLTFISASPTPDTGTDNLWTLGDLDSEGSGIIKVTLQASSTLTDGSVLSSSAQISSIDGPSAQASASTVVRSIYPSLVIEKSASDQVIQPGGTLDYEIIYRNAGDYAATNVTITDVVDANLEFDAANSNPMPSKIWQEADGTHLWWNSSSLNSGTMQPGDSGTINLQVSLPSDPQHPNYDWVYNNYKIDSDETLGDFLTLSTAVIHSLYIRKIAERQVYATGEMVKYTLKYGNELVVDLEDAVVIDILPNSRYMEYVDADPAPSSIEGNTLIWNIGDIPSKSSGVIYLYAKIVQNRSTINYFSNGKVSGQGYVNFDQRLDTAENLNRLTNYANITAWLSDHTDTPESDSSSATIILSESFGTALDIIGHGSGTYSREEDSRLHSMNKTLQAKTSLSEKYSGTSFSLPGERTIDYNSKWSEAQRAKNRVTGSTIVERYMYADRIDRDSNILLDKNGSTLESQTSFQGAGHIGLLKESAENITQLYVVEGPAHNRPAPTYESQEDYLGSYNITIKFDEYGTNAESDRSVSGAGFAASDKRVGKSQRSHESGTGTYQAEDKIQTASNYIAKDLNATFSSMSYSYTPDFQVDLSQKWKEGMWSKSGDIAAKGTEGNDSSSEPASFIGEEYTQADYLNKSTVALGLNQMKTEAQFQGRARFKAVYDNVSNQSRDQFELYDEYVGKYSIARNVEIGGVARFDEPHLSITKVSQKEPSQGTFINYLITVTNDGNRALGPVYVQDLLPTGTEYVYSSARPSHLTQNSVEWTLLSLGIGGSSNIELKLNITQDVDGLVNRVKANGGYDGQWVVAENYSTLQLGWLSCCPPQLLATKDGFVDSNDSKLIHYLITLKNREKESMVATITDQLPAGIMFLNSSQTPSDYSSDRITWSTIDLEPGEMKTIDYLARALQGGTFVNHAHIDAQYLNGTDFVWADVSCSVYIGGAAHSTSSSIWQPPSCFGLSCTYLDGTDAEEEWIPCHYCGATEPKIIDMTACDSCNSTSESD
jgi:uncharacterized repeat protein (TIGR01451 family)